MLSSFIDAGFEVVTLVVMKSSSLLGFNAV
jgi:hypothetical protein